MKKIFAIFWAIAMLAACDKVDNAAQNDKLVLTGYNNTDTRTGFGTPDSEKIPFLWSKGDYIWLGENKSSAIAEDCSLAKFEFEAGTAVVGTGHIFYNMTGTAKTAKVLAEQTADGNLGNDGDFGYATLDEYNSFYLVHKTSYIWFDTTTDDDNMPNLSAITVKAADGVNIAGQRVYDFNNDAWADTVTDGSSEITLTFADGYALSAANEGVMAAMVCLPAAVSGTELTITYTFADGRTYTETKTPSKDFTVGATSRVATKIAEEDLVTPEPELSYELRVLTFEDGSEKFAAYTITGYDNTTYSYYDHKVTSWNNLIDTPEYGGPLAYGDMGFNGEMRGCDYHWYDEGNTYLASELPTNYGSQVYWGGGHVISHYAAEDYTTYGTYNNQMTVFGVGQEYDVTRTGGRNGSKNFAMHYGYKDGSDYNMTENLPYIYFGDGEARVIDHMWVNNSCYAISCYMDGNGLTAKIGEEDWVKVVATGYDADGNTTTAEIYLCNGPDNIVTDWTKWDLSSLGAVVMVEFNITGSSDNGYGFSQPAYFAYDDVAVRFEK